jgi:hypothetical protein
MSLIKNPKNIKDYSSWSIIREDSNKVFSLQQKGKIGSNINKEQEYRVVTSFTPYLLLGNSDSLEDCLNLFRFCKHYVKIDSNEKDKVN